MLLPGILDPAVAQDLTKGQSCFFLTEAFWSFAPFQTF